MHGHQEEKEEDEQASCYPSRNVRMQQVFDLLIVNFQKHDAHEAARSILMGFNPLKKLPATEQDQSSGPQSMHQYSISNVAICRPASAAGSMHAVVI